MEEGNPQAPAMDNRAEADQNPGSLPPPAVRQQPRDQASADPMPGADMPEEEPIEGFDMASAAREAGIDRLLEIPLTIHVELGRKKMRIRDLTQLGAGTVVPLDTQAGAHLSIYANRTLIAEGEAVVVGERYGVRITDIVSPAERVRRLGEEE